MDLSKYENISEDTVLVFNNALKEYIKSRNSLLEIETLHNKTFICDGFTDNLIIGVSTFFKGLSKDLSNEDEVQNCFLRAEKHFLEMKAGGYNGVRNIWAEQLFQKVEYAFLGGKNIKLGKFLLITPIKNKYDEISLIHTQLNSVKALNINNRLELTERFLERCYEFENLIKDNSLNVQNAILGQTKCVFRIIKIILLIINLLLFISLFK